jgi:alcohol dehydrogenase
MAARIALVDPMLTVTLPPNITAFTGIDALVHAIEGYTATLSQPVSDSLALSAIELIANNIRPAYANGKNLTARYNMMLASMLAGMSFGNSDTASVHCMGEAIGGLYDVPHGLSMAVFLPHCIEYNIIANPDKFARIAQALGENVAGLPTMEAAGKSVNAIQKICKDLNIPSARAVGLKKEDLNQLAEAAAINVAVDSNPRAMRKEDFLLLYKKAYDQE